MYACREGQWIAIAVRNEGEWERFCEAAGHGEWATDERYLDNAARKRNEATLDADIGAWSATEDVDALEARLVAAGIVAGKVLGPQGVSQNAQLRDRNFIVELEHPETGPLDYVGVPVRFSATPGAATMAAPTSGQHSWEVLSTLLGMERAEYEELEADGVTGSGPPPGFEAEE
jgi:crotonobetainyl-CoA:carnitine CoA-transferase CaiB-like acyl-CoA transferase